MTMDKRKTPEFKEARRKSLQEYWANKKKKREKEELGAEVKDKKTMSKTKNTTIEPDMSLLKMDNTKKSSRQSGWKYTSETAPKTGRVKGTKNKVSLAAVLDPETHEVALKHLKEKIQEGNEKALDTYFNLVYAKPKYMPENGANILEGIKFDNINDIKAMMRVILLAYDKGNITADVAEFYFNCLKEQRDVVAESKLEARIEALENR